MPSLQLWMSWWSWQRTDGGGLLELILCLQAQLGPSPVSPLGVVSAKRFANVKHHTGSQPLK